MTRQINTVIWDWNGTLLNDLEICIMGINRLLERRGLSLLEKQRYRQIFTFPVRDYYLAAGFDFSREAFEVPAEEFIKEYNSLLPQAALFADVKDTLDHFHKKGMRQFIVSAMEQNALLKSVSGLGIDHYFEKISGISDNLAFSKLSNAIELFKAHGVQPAGTILVGDTLHDYEVGSQLGVEVVLVSRGHQCQSRLRLNGNAVFSDFTGMRAWLEK